MREEEIETAIKVVVVGNGAVGKSSMIQRYCKGIDLVCEVSRLTEIIKIAK